MFKLKLPDRYGVLAEQLENGSLKIEDIDLEKELTIQLFRLNSIGVQFVNEALEEFSKEAVDINVAMSLEE